MIRISDGPAPAGGADQPAVPVADLPWGALDAWPRLVEAGARATFHAERAWLGAYALAWYPLLPDDPRPAEGWAQTAGQAQRAALDAWGTCVQEAARLTSAAVIELRSSAVRLLEQLEDERAARRRLEQQLERAHARAEREHAERQAAEHKAEDQRRRAGHEQRAREQAERAVERLERELAHERELAQKRQLAHERELAQARERAGRAEQAQAEQGRSEPAQGEPARAPTKARPRKSTSRRS
jgi:hypothetical protein